MLQSSWGAVCTRGHHLEALLIPAKPRRGRASSLPDSVLNCSPFHDNSAIHTPGSPHSRSRSFQGALFSALQTQPELIWPNAQSMEMAAHLTDTGPLLTSLSEDLRPQRTLRFTTNRNQSDQVLPSLKIFSSNIFYHASGLTPCKSPA